MSSDDLIHKVRDRRIEMVRRRLLRKGMPRFLVFVILLLAGLAGFFTSFALLHLGVLWMWIRYPIAILVAYAVFFLLLRFWLSLVRRRVKHDFDPSGVDLNLFEATSRSAEAFRFGGGGDFGGAGAGGSWGESVSSAQVSSGQSVSSVGGFDVDLDEGWLVVIAVVAMIGGLIATFYVVYIAPALLAEIIVDAGLMIGLYRRVKRIDQRHWLRGAVRQTLAPALLVAIFFTIAGYAMQRAVPTARSIAEVLNHLMQR